MSFASPVIPINQQVAEHQQVNAVMGLVPTYANKFFLTMEDNMVRVTFADENNKYGITTYRASIIMSINGFMALVGMLGPQAETIKKQFEALQAANTENPQ